MVNGSGEFVGRLLEQIKRRRALVENQGRLLVERLLAARQCATGKPPVRDSAGRSAASWRPRPRPRPRMRVAAACALAMVSAAWRSAADLIFCASASPSYCALLMSFCRSDFMRSNTVCVTLSGRPIFLKPRNSMLDAVIVRPQFGLHRSVRFPFQSRRTSAAVGSAIHEIGQVDGCR